MPFTTGQFLEVFARYNTAVWPAQLALVLAALAVLALLRSRSPLAGRSVAAILAGLWIWSAVVYHMGFFARINPAAWLFAGLFFAGAAAFVWVGMVRARLRFPASDSTRARAGWAMIAFALVVYPAIAFVVGHRYPATPTFGLPCPTAMFTLGVLVLADRVPRILFVAPLAWAAIASTAAFALGIYEDFGLTVAALVAAALIVRPRAWIIS